MSIQMLRLIPSDHLQGKGGIDGIYLPEPKMPQGELLAPSAVPGQLNVLKLLLSSSEKQNISHDFRDLQSVNQIKGLNDAQTNLWLKRQAGKHQWCPSLAMDTLLFLLSTGDVKRSLQDCSRFWLLPK